MKVKCPTCHEEFNSLRGMRSHHTQVHGQSLIEGKCEVCGKVFKRWTDSGRFCSLECAGKYFSQKYSKRKAVVCEACGETFSISPSRIRRRYCSRECYRRSLKTIPVDREKFLDLLRASPFGTGTLASAAKVHPDEVQRLIAREEGRFPLVRKLEKIIGSFRL